MKGIAILFFISVAWCPIIFGLNHKTVVAPKSTLEVVLEDTIQSIEAETETNVIAQIDWLNNTPLSQQKNLRDEKTRYILDWMTESSAISVRIDDRLVTLEDVDPVLLFTYMIGWTKYSLTNNNLSDATKCTVAALESVIVFYRKNKDVIKKNKQVEKYAALMDSGELTDYVHKILSKP